MKDRSEQNLDTKHVKPESDTLHSQIDMREFRLASAQTSHRAAEDSISFIDFAKAGDPYSSKGSHESGKSAHDSGKSATASVEHLSDQQFDLGKAVQGLIGSAVEAGKHIFDGLNTEAPKASPEEREKPEVIKVFNPQMHGEAQSPIWSVDQFHKFIAQNKDNEDYFYPDDEPTKDIDPGFRLPSDKNAPEIDRGFQIPSDRTTRKVIKDDGIKQNNDEAIDAILSGAR